jgi:FkbM family methyltransferase
MPEINIKCKPTPYGPMLFLAHDKYIGRSFDLYGEFSTGEHSFFKYACKGGAAIDVGANIGAHSVMMAKCYGHVYAFEPQEFIYRLLVANLAKDLNTTTYHAAVGVTEGIIHLPAMDYSVGPNNFGGLGRDVLEHYDIKQRDEIPLIPTQLRQLDKVEALQKESQIDLLKVDVEGMELEVLQGAQGLIATHRPLMYVENDRLPKAQALVQFIYNLEYKAYWHITDLYNPHNFAGNLENVFKDIVSFNLICIPNDKKCNITGLECSPNNLNPPPGFVI